MKALQQLDDSSNTDALFEKYTAIGAIENHKDELLAIIGGGESAVHTSMSTVKPKKQNTKPGPDENLMKEILERTGYSNEITAGQRKYGGPPPNWTGATPGNGCEVCFFASSFNPESRNTRFQMRERLLSVV